MLTRWELGGAGIGQEEVLGKGSVVIVGLFMGLETKEIPLPLPPSTS